MFKDIRDNFQSSKIPLRILNIPKNWTNIWNMKKILKNTKNF